MHITIYSMYTHSTPSIFEWQHDKRGDNIDMILEKYINKNLLHSHEK